MDLAWLESRPLSEDVHVINKDSNNLHAEILLRLLGVKFGAALTEAAGASSAAVPARSLSGAATVQSGAAAPRPKPAEILGAAVVRDFLKRLGAEVPPLSLRDGSGLSRHNLITPAATFALLRHVARQPYADVFLDSLPVAATDGTLRRRFGGTAAAGKLRAKTGSIAQVNALAGYVTTAQGERVVFSLVVNNHTGDARATETIDAVCRLLAEYKGKL
jgi:D-alanyl-D-alanine carboxypeptidase/D-alanyl-D-alanine-endopeptidase (penicillin-binding protein 4)